MKDNQPICIIGGYDPISKSFFNSLKKKYNSTLFINLLETSYSDKNLFTYKIFELKKIFSLLKLNKINEIIFLGKIIRPNLSDFKKDGIVEKYIPLLLQAYKKGDGAVLNEVIKIFKEHKFKIVSPFKYSDEYRFSQSNVTKILANEDHLDITKSSNLLNAISRYDNAQSVISINGYIYGIEAVEGTDALLNRVYKLRHQYNQLQYKSGFLVKKPKKNQSKLIDLPVIGPQTINLIYKANLKGLALDYKNTMIYKRNKVLELIKQYNLIVYDIG